jgi:hypothetical protein
MDTTKLLPPLFILPSWTISKDGSKIKFYSYALLLIGFGISQVVLVILHGSTCPSMGSLMILSGIFYTVLSLCVLSAYVLYQQTTPNKFVVLFVVLSGYSFFLLAPSAAVATAVLFSYFSANNLCKVDGTPNPGLMIAVEPLVASVLCATCVFIFFIYCIRQELVDRGVVQSTCCSCFNNICSAKGDGDNNVWSRIITATTSSSSSSSLSQSKSRKSKCCKIFLWSVIVSVLAWLIVSGWLGLLPGQWSCLPLKPSGCEPFVKKADISLLQQNAVLTPLPAYKLTLWHEGYPIKTDGSNDKIFIQYVQSLVEFCIDWKFQRCFLQLYNPKSTTTKPHTSFEAASVATHFVQPLLKAGIEAGFVVYARPKDTGWDRKAPLTDIAKYIQEVEAVLKVKKNGIGASKSKEESEGTSGDDGNHVCCLAFDHEDLGALAKDVSSNILSLKKNGLMWNGMQVGYAGGASLLSMSGDMEPGITDLYPELYWYGELAPGHEKNGFFTCTTDCVTAMPCFSSSCVTTPYRQYVDQPDELLNRVILPHLKKNGLGGTDGMYASSLSRSKGRVIWSMFSFEHLAGCCPERAFGPGNSCGTFDGLALWTKQKVLDLFQAYSIKAGYNSSVQMPIAVYEFQFIPPHLRDTSLSNDPVLKKSVSSAVPLLCDGT